MKKVFMAIALCLMCAFVCVSCSNKQEEEQVCDSTMIEEVIDSVAVDTLVCDSVKADTVVVNLPEVK